MKYSPAIDRYTQMKYKRCGNSGVQLPLVSLGLWHNFGDVDNFKIATKIITRAFDLGITHFDLANNYGPPPGSAEINFGTILSRELDGYRDQLIISTKAGYTMWEGPYGDWGSKKYLVSSLDQSLHRMGLDYVDIFYHHRFDPNTPLEETMGTLDLMVRQGKALYVGISNYNPEQTQKAIEILNKLGTPLLIHQPKYSMFERTPEKGLFQTLLDHKVGCIPFSPLAQGMLTDRYIDGIPSDSRAAKSHGFLKKEQISEDKLRIIKELNSLAKKRNQSLAQMALAWVLRNEAVTTVLIGASSVEQLDANVGCINNLDFSSEELSTIEELLK
ncbi:MAG: aldo/keto reductase [Bacteroidota bacterium]|nr:aldo/keto reductase [Bacteroidota bacterium]